VCLPTAVNVKVMVVCDMVLCSLVDRYYCFGETCCLYPKDGGSGFPPNVFRCLPKYRVFSEYYNFEGRLFFCPLEQCFAKWLKGGVIVW